MPPPGSQQCGLPHALVLLSKVSGADQAGTLWKWLASLQVCWDLLGFQTLPLLVQAGMQARQTPRSGTKWCLMVSPLSVLQLLPIPDSLPISPDDGEHADIYKLRIRVRGNLEWAPPRPQIIFNVHPAPT